jgi:hypothetical protein
MIRLSGQLVRLEDSVPVNIQDAIWNGFNQEELSPLLDTLEFRSLFEELSSGAPSIASKKSRDNDNNEEVRKKDYRLIDSKELLELLKKILPLTTLPLILRLILLIRYALIFLESLFHGFQVKPII